MELFLNSLNWVDIVFLVVLVYFVASNRGFLSTLVEIFGFVFSLFVSYRLYAVFGKFIVDKFSAPQGIAQALGFFVTWFIVEMGFFFIAHRLLDKALKKTARNPANVSLGYIAGGIQGSIIFLFFISLIFALPVRGQVKKDILDSQTGPFFVNLSQAFESKVKEVFGGAANETLNFLTVKPTSDTTVDLGFKVPRGEISFDPRSETAMYNLVNQERTTRSESTLQFDPSLQEVARTYAVVMLTHGFFSHVSVVDGSDASQRASTAGISYSIIGENLAFAPDVYVAHQGLMNSEGHRKNILFPEYTKIGIGVADAGIYGKMFVQLFSD